jgi:hypothetical protein
LRRRLGWNPVLGWAFPHSGWSGCLESGSFFRHFDEESSGKNCSLGAAVSHVEGESLETGGDVYFGASVELSSALRRKGMMMNIKSIELLGGETRGNR